MGCIFSRLRDNDSVACCFYGEKYGEDEEGMMNDEESFLDIYS